MLYYFINIIYMLFVLCTYILCILFILVSLDYYYYYYYYYGNIDNDVKIWED